MDIATIAELESIIAGAPREPGPMADGLLGWTRGDALSVCGHCAGRIIARGFGTAFKGWDVHFSGEDYLWEGCDLPSCGRN
jgi:hypothetical protein